ncbi:MAG: metalloregulator ArsR/SmtB family transcription factor [Flavobacteriaceae bacterium]|nr:metalloregulator ArsR/SmtB family transcription factor [Flavobacteriaceae bacterium]
MGTTKSQIFNNKQNEVARYAKVLGHPARVAILQELFKMKSCFCGSLVDVIGLAQPTISQHLKELKNAGLVQGTIEGTSVCYCINEQGWAQMQVVLGEFVSTDIEKKNDCC